jgi:hypothetical protein
MANKQYQSEDIETLLIQKEFSELLPEEKDFVLSHLESETEYTRMRNVLFQLIEMDSNDIPDGPDERVKNNLDALFNDSSKKRTLWQSIPFWSISGIAAVLVIGFFYFRNTQPAIEQVAFADNKVKSDTSLTKSTDSEKASSNEINKENTQLITPIVMEESILDEVTDAAPPQDDTDKEMNSMPSMQENIASESVIANSANSKFPETDATSVLMNVPSFYPGGESKLISDTHRILSNVTYKKETSSEKKKATDLVKAEVSQPEKIIFKIQVAPDGKVDNVQVVKSRTQDQQQISMWTNALKKELKNFNFSQPVPNATFYLPIQLEVD